MRRRSDGPRAKRLALSLLAAAGFGAATAASLYANHDYGEVELGLAPLETGAALVAGFVIGRWWSPLLALVCVPLLLFAPYAGETDSDGATLRDGVILAGPVFSLWLAAPLLLGVTMRKAWTRRHRWKSRLYG
jgi:hypothetical protein